MGDANPSGSRPLVDRGRLRPAVGFGPISDLPGNDSLDARVLTQHNPLYQVEYWAQSLPLALLWGQGITAHQFNDDALGRVLEDLADHGRTLLATLGPRMQAVRGTGPMMLHSDTTAFALFGDYPNIHPQITQGGFSKWRKRGTIKAN